jgi:hypothetical protein
VQSLKNPTKVVGIGHIGSEYHRDLQLWEMSGEEAVRNIKELPWLPNIGDWATMQTTVWPQGNRLYVRSKDSLYCVGDPRHPYHRPAGTPAAARTD